MTTRVLKACGLYFNGRNAYVKTPLPTSKIANVSFGAFFKTLDYRRPRQGIIHVGNVGADMEGIDGYSVTINNGGVSDGKLRVLYDLVMWYDTGIYVTDTDWHHVWVNIMSDSHPEVYFDGKKVWSGAAYTPKTPTYNAYIGVNMYYFYGFIYLPIVVERTLSDSEVNDLAKYEIIPKDSVVLCLPMTDYEGNTVKDYSGRGNDGTLYGCEWVIKKAKRLLSI